MVGGKIVPKGLIEIGHFNGNNNNATTASSKITIISTSTRRNSISITGLFSITINDVIKCPSGSISTYNKPKKNANNLNKIEKIKYKNYSDKPNNDNGDRCPPKSV